MKNKLFRLLFFLSFASFISSCSTELDINGDKKDVMIVYGILDANSKTQYIKINRAFLGEGNALQYSQIPDSTLYPYLLNVTLDVLNSSGQSIRQYVADTVHIYKESDVFFSGYQPYYRFVLDDPQSGTSYLNPSLTYKLTIVDPVTGNIYESESPGLGGSFILNSPASNPNDPRIDFEDDVTRSVKWESLLNGKLYELKFVFHYYEIWDNDPTDTIEKTANWDLGSVTSSSALISGEDLAVNYSNHDFFYLLGQQIEASPYVQRYPGYIDLVITIGGEDLNTYIDVNQPSSSIIQERPSFSNITNGIGLFSCKYIYKKSFKLKHPDTVNLLIYGEYTSDLNFNEYWANFPHAF